MKYIILNDKHPIVFDACLVHAAIAKGFPDARVTGAGHCSLYIRDGKAKWHCYGLSTSLKVESNGDDDSDILNLVFRGH